MGHTGSIESRYATNKRQLSYALFNEMRNVFDRSEKYLNQVTQIHYKSNGWNSNRS